MTPFCNIDEEKKTDSLLSVHITPGRLACLNRHRVSVGVPCSGRTSCPDLVPTLSAAAARMDCRHPPPGTRMVAWKLINLSLIYGQLTFISMFSIKSVLGLWKFGGVFVTRNKPQEFKSCLYQLACGNIGFVIHRNLKPQFPKTYQH